VSTYKQKLGAQFPKYSRPIYIPARLDDAGLSDKAFRILCHLSRRADKKGLAWPTLTQIRDQCKGTRVSIVAAIRQLKARGFLEILRKKPFLFRLTNPEEWQTPIVKETELYIVKGYLS
jgi:DNA-binding MarR family transcriptional regulator